MSFKSIVAAILVGLSLSGCWAHHGGFDHYRDHSGHHHGGYHRH